MSFRSEAFHVAVDVPSKAAARSDVLRALDDGLLRIQKSIQAGGFEPNWGSTMISTSEPEFDESLSMTGTSLIEQTYPGRFTVSVQGVKRA